MCACQRRSATSWATWQRPFNAMAAALAAKDSQLLTYTTGLEQKIQERTRA